MDKKSKKILKDLGVEEEKPFVKTTPEEARYTTLKSLLDRDRNMAYKTDFFKLAKGREEDIPRLIEDLDWFEGLLKFESKFGKREKDKEKIELPGQGILISQFAQTLVNRIKKEHVVFYRQDSRQVVELGIIKDSEGKISHTGFIPIKPSRFITLVERYFNPWTTIYTKNGNSFEQDKSMTKDIGGTVLDSLIFQEELPNINRIFTVQIPIIYKGELTFPKEGYDKRFNSWLPIDAPVIKDLEMPLEKAKEMLYDILKEFCFETSQDYTNAISALLTPFLRGLFKTGFNTRSPISYYEANRERSGKDYLAGITGILYEGHALEEPPISNGEYRSSGGNDELRKKIVSAMMSGRKRLHFSNNKGHLNNSILESVTTAEKYSDRLLGKNEIVTFDNELDFSFSGNLGITLTPDLANRTLFIKLFLDIEDANKRKFNNPNLHLWIKENRGEVLSALYSLVRNWFDNKCPKGTIPFASFPEWARVCGGIMECAGYNSPCKSNKEELGIAIDSETEDMKALFEICYKDKPDTWIKKDDIRNIIIDPSENIMPYIQWDDRSAQTKFGIKLNKFVGRIMSDIRLIVEDKSIRSSRWKYKFVKNQEKINDGDIFGNEEYVSKGGNVTINPLSDGIHGYVVPTLECPLSEEVMGSRANVANVTKVTTPFSEEEIKEAGYSKEELKKILEDKK